MRVFVYYNLRKKLFSVKALEGENKGRVIAHRDEVTMMNAFFRVSQAGRQRVLREKRKNIHAGVIGDWFDDHPETILDGRSVTYNPYTHKYFITKDDGQPVFWAYRVNLKDKKVTVFP